MTVVSVTKKGIVHLERSIASGEIDGNGLIVPEYLAVAEFEAIDGKGKKSFDDRVTGNAAGSSLRKIGCAVGIKSDMDHRLLEDNFVESRTRNGEAR